MGACTLSRICCYHAWRSTTKTQHLENDHFVSERLQLEVASNLLKGIFFPIYRPEQGTSYLSMILVVVLALLLLSSHIMLEVAAEQHDNHFYSFAFLPTWLSFAVFYPLLYMFFCRSSWPNIVVGVLFCVSFQATCLLSYFYLRELSGSVSRIICYAVGTRCSSFRKCLWSTRRWLCHRNREERDIMQRSQAVACDSLVKSVRPIVVFSCNWALWSCNR